MGSGSVCGHGSSCSSSRVSLNGVCLNGVRLHRVCLHRVSRVNRVSLCRWWVSMGPLCR